MKKILYILLVGASVFLLASCMEIDNFDAPDAHVTGRLIDATTGQNFMMSHAQGHIRIWERSFTGRPDPVHQSIPVQQNGTFNNRRLFAGTYDMLPFGLPIWPTDTVFHVPIGRRTVTQDFRVYPLLRIVDFNVQLNATGDSLIFSCRIYAPATQRQVTLGGVTETMDLPPLVRVRPMLSLLYFVGPGHELAMYNINRFWIDFTAAAGAWSNIDTDGDGYSDITLANVMPVAAQPYASVREGVFTVTVPIPAAHRGQAFNVRMGARAHGGAINTEQRYNLSEIVRIHVP